MTLGAAETRPAAAHDDPGAPSWFDEAKLGVFIHWNPAAIAGFAPLTSLEGMLADETPGEADIPFPGDGIQVLRRLPYAEMYWNTMLIEGSPTQRHHRERFGDAPYDAFVERFRDEMIPAWDPDPLADVIAGAGAGYAVLFVMTEDGFLMWPSDHPNPHKGRRWQSERDVVGELGEAVRSRGVRYGVAYSGGMDWTFGELPMRSWAELVAMRPQGPDYIAYADAHWRELIDRYAPDVLWNDYSYPRGADVEAIFRRYRERVPDGVINNRWGEEIEVMTPFPGTDFITPEYSTEGTPEQKWEACRGLGTSFGYNRQESEATYMSSTELIHTFVDVVSRGGNLLINVAPTAAGRVPWAQASRLRELGWWLRENGAAIYATRPWSRHRGVSGEGLGVRYTRSEDAVNAIVLGTPSEARLELDLRLDEGAEVTVPGHSRPLAWTESPAGIAIELPEPPDERPALSLRISPADAVREFDET